MRSVREMSNCVASELNASRSKLLFPVKTERPSILLYGNFSKSDINAVEGETLYLAHSRVICTVQEPIKTRELCLPYNNNILFSSWLSRGSLLTPDCRHFTRSRASRF